MLAHLNIGSNIGDSRSAIERAVAAVSALSDLGKPQVSDIIESEPWGFESVNRFLNVGINILTSLQPFELLDHTQAIEREISPQSHRNPDGSYCDRLIDIDIIVCFNFPNQRSTELFRGYTEKICNCVELKTAWNVIRLDHPRLTLPHPRAAQREFVLGPLQQLLPDLPLDTLLLLFEG